MADKSRRHNQTDAPDDIERMEEEGATGTAVDAAPALADEIVELRKERDSFSKGNGKSLLPARIRSISTRLTLASRYSCRSCKYFSCPSPATLFAGLNTSMTVTTRPPEEASMISM